VDLLHLLQDVGLFLGGQPREVFQDGAQLPQHQGEVGRGRPAFLARRKAPSGGAAGELGKGNDLVLDGEALSEARANDEKDPLVDGIGNGLRLMADVGMAADDPVHVRPVPTDLQ
jgi:hypothetical protein